MSVEAFKVMLTPAVWAELEDLKKKWSDAKDHLDELRLAIDREYYPGTDDIKPGTDIYGDFAIALAKYAIERAEGEYLQSIEYYARTRFNYPDSIVDVPEEAE